MANIKASVKGIWEVLSSENLLRFVTLCGILAAGTWAYWNYILTETPIPNVTISLSTEILPYKEELRLLVIHVKPKNLGKVTVEPDKDGFTLTISELPTNGKAWTVLGAGKTPLLKPIDLVERDKRAYELLPGAEYDEIETVVAERGKLLLIEAVFNFEGDYVDAKQVVIVK